MKIHRRNWRSFCLSVAFICGLATPLWSAEVAGVVRDRGRSPVPGVRVTFVNIGDDTSSASGEFHIRVPDDMVGKRVTVQAYKEGWTVPSSFPLNFIVPANAHTDPIVITLAKAGKPLATATSQDTIADFSVLPSDIDSPGTFDTVYSADRAPQGIAIKPNVPYLSLLASGGPIGPNRFWWTPFKPKLPELDIKLVNNSKQTIFFTEADFLVDQSQLDPTPILLIDGEGYEMEMSLLNLGWGPLVDPTLHFELLPLHSVPQDTDSLPAFIKTQRSHLNLQIPVTENNGAITLDFGPTLASLGVDVPTLRNHYYEAEFGGPKGSAYTFKNPDGTTFTLNEKQYANRLTKANGPFAVTGDSRHASDGAALMIGELSYKTSNGAGTRTTVALYNVIYFGEPGAGAPRPPSFAYSVKLDVDGQHYVKKVALSQVLQPQEADRFTIKIAADKSSRHSFKVRLFYNDGKYVESPPISMDLFMPRLANDYLEPELAAQSASAFNR